MKNTIFEKISKITTYFQGLGISEEAPNSEVIKVSLEK